MDRPTVVHLKRKSKNYYVSPIHSGESDSGADPDFINKHPGGDKSSTKCTEEVINGNLAEIEATNGKKEKRSVGSWSLKRLNY
ncbi:unnamed protein product [Acanthoscelides obtectus]|uniref:Uncharacterized protein n=1 Tax=Acanthoscelides obtectus TaxID=200917 RepID=A0A9P0QGK4_ACAOB|nr:unnamed protein product [Acanthoscelides obtectus]CAK1682685.1 hypothetical protein AOBTE_LOCUS33790 [Acanthoscelides obtectus]